MYSDKPWHSNRPSDASLQPQKSSLANNVYVIQLLTVTIQEIGYCDLSNFNAQVKNYKL